VRRQADRQLFGSSTADSLGWAAHPPRRDNAGDHVSFVHILTRERDAVAVRPCSCSKCRRRSFRETVERRLLARTSASPCSDAPRRSRARFAGVLLAELCGASERDRAPIGAGDDAVAPLSWQVGRASSWPGRPLAHVDADVLLLSRERARRGRGASRFAQGVRRRRDRQAVEQDRLHIAVDNVEPPLVAALLEAGADANEGWRSPTRPRSMHDGAKPRSRARWHEEASRRDGPA